MLLKIRDYLLRERLVSLQQIARVFRMDEGAMQPILAFWINRGLITLDDNLSCGTTCSGCHASRNTMYRVQTHHPI